MTPKRWIVRVLFAGLLWIFLVCVLQNGVVEGGSLGKHKNKKKQYFKGVDTACIVVENFTCIVRAKQQMDIPGRAVFVFLNETSSRMQRILPKLSKDGASYYLYLRKGYTKKKVKVYFLHGNNCSQSFRNLTGGTKTSIQSRPNLSICNINNDATSEDQTSGLAEKTEHCQVRCFHLNTICAETQYEGERCSRFGGNNYKNYIINVTAENTHCNHCVNPAAQPDQNISLNPPKTTEGGALDAQETVKMMNKIKDLALNLDGTSAALSGGDGIDGVIMTETDLDDAEEIFFAYSSPNDSIHIVANTVQDDFPRSVSVSKEAFQKAFANADTVFAAVLRFTNFSPDELNSTILENEVLAIEMGVNITNLTEKINIHFKNVKYDGSPSCRSWNSEGVCPRWTDDGCETVISDGGIMCQCSHLTFFAILLTPLNQTISNSDLSNLSIITQVGCGLSSLFLSIALFMHYLLRRKKATDTTKILIHLLWAMLLLNLTFLINASVSNLNHTVGCKIIAAAMHYFMLATFTWFAVQAFHLCLQMYSRGKILIKRYVLKVSVTSWGIPSLIVIVLLSVDKYGQQVIHTDGGANNVTMCWITDGDIHYIVNISYYALIFVFTFSTLVIILTWFFGLKRTNSGSPQANKSSLSMMTVMGLCCLLGVTWAFAFFAYGVLRLPSYYIFTVLNSFQGFFLFIYYYTNSNVKEMSTSPSVGVSSSSSSSNTTATTLGKGLSSLENPYNPAAKPQASEDG